MSQTVDQRVVEMRFDNKQFESAIADTQKSIKGFNKNLNKEFSDSDKSFGKLETAAENVRVKFGILDVFKFEVLQRTIGSLVSQAERLVKSFTIEPVAAGWQKYADKTSAVQTIMNSTGESIENVEGQLDKLNWFADETSYSFIDMTSNVGKFTSAGVELDKAVTAMQGISTWAALSGANTEQASRAMYNLSQAMAMGSVRVQDWMSIENANMATKEFKEMAIATARDLKVLNKETGEWEDHSTLKVDNDGITYAPDTKKGVDVDYKNFRSTLSEGWLTDEVLTSVLEQYGKAADLLKETQALSGVDTTSELLKNIDLYREAVDEASREKVFQDFISEHDLEDDTEAIKTLREQFDLLISDEYELAVRAFKAAQEAKTFREAIDATKDAVSTKWMNVFQDIFGSYDKAKKLWTDVSNILWDIFAGPIDNLHAATKQWSENGGLEDVHAIITGILQTISDVWQAIRDVINLIRYGTTDAEEVAEKKAERLKVITGAIRSIVEGIQAFVTSKPFKNAILGIGKIVASVANIFKAAWGIIKTIFGSIIKAFQSFISVVNFKRLAKAMKTSSGRDYKEITFISVLDWIRQKLDSLAEWLRSSGVTAFISNTIGKFVGFLLKIPGKINNAFKALTGITIGEAFQKLFEKIKQGFQWIINNQIIQSIWNGIKSFFSMIGNGLKSLAGVETYGELFEKIKQKVVIIFTAIGDFFKNVWTKLKELSKVNTGKELWDKIKSKIGEFFGFIKGLFSKKGNNGEKSLTEFAEDTSRSFSAITKVVGRGGGGGSAANRGGGPFGSRVVRSFAAVNKLPRAITESKEVKETPVVWEKSKNVLSNAFKAIVDFVKKIKWSDIFLTLFSIKSFAKTLRKLRMSKAILNISEGIAQFGRATVEFAYAARKFAEAAKVYAKAQKRRALASVFRSVGTMILAIGVAVGLIAYSIWQLAKLDPESLKQGATIVGAILIALLVFMIVIVSSLKVLSKNIGPDNQKAVSKTMSSTFGMMSILLTSIAFLMKRLVKQIILLSNIKDKDALMRATYIVGALLLIVFGMILLLMKSIRDEKKGLLKNGGSVSKVSSEASSTIASAALLLAALTIVTKALAKSVFKLAKIENPARLWSAFAVVALLLATVFAIIFVTLNFVRDDKEGTLKDGKRQKTLSKNAASTIAATALLLFALGSVIGSLAASLFVISKIKPDRLWPAVGALASLIGLVLLTIGALILLTNSYEMKKGKGISNKMDSNCKVLLSLSVLFVAFGVLLGSMAKTLAILSLIKDPKGLIIGIVAIGLLLAALVGIIAIAKNVNFSTLLSLSVTFLSLGTTMILMATAFLLLLPVITVLSKFKFGDLAKVAGGILLVLTAFAIGGTLLTAALPGLIGFGAFVLMLSVSIGILAVSISLLAAGLTAFGIGLVAFCATIAAAGPVIKAAIKTIIEAFFGAIEAFVLGILYTLNGIIPVLGELIVTLIDTVCKTLVQSIPQIGETIVVVVLAILDTLERTLPRIIEVTFQLIMLLLDAIANNAYAIGEALMKILIGVFQAVADNIGPLVTAFADLLVNLFNSLTNELPRILESLGGFLFSVVENTIGMLVKSVFQSFGEALNIFAEAAGTFWDVIKDVDPAAMAAIGILGDMMIALTAASVLESINKLMTFGKSDTPLVALGKQLSAFAPYLTSFAQSTAGINADHVEHVASACAILGELANSLPRSGGVLQQFFGESMSMYTFGEQLKSFGLAFVDFYNTISPIFPIDNSAVESVANAGATMAGLYDKLPKTEGWAQAIFGEAMSLKEFGSQLKDFGTAFVDFYNTIKPIMPIDKDAVESVTNAGATLGGLYNKLPRTSGWTQKIFGEAMNLKEFGSQLKDFGTGFIGFYSTIKPALPIDKSLVTSASNVASVFAGLYNKLPRVGGWIDDLFGKPTSLKTFGADVVEFGKAFVKFYSVITEAGTVDHSLVTTVNNVASVFAGLYDKLPKVDGWIDNLFGKSMTLKDFGTDLVYFAHGFNSFYTEISKQTVDESIVNTVTNAATTLATLYTKINEVGHSGWLESIFGKRTIDLADFGTQLATFGIGFNTFYNEISKNEIDQAIVDTVTNAAKTMVALYKEINFNGGKPGWLASIFGKKAIDLGSFGTQLGEFGTGFNTFYNTIKDLKVSQDQVASVSNAAKMLVELYKGLNGERGGVFGAIADFFTGSEYDKKKDTVNHAVEIMGILADGIVKHATKFSVSEENRMAKFADTVSTFMQSFSSVISQKDAVKSMKNSGEDLKTFVSNMASTIKTAAGTTFDSIGDNFASSILGAMAKYFDGDNVVRKQQYDTLEKSLHGFVTLFSDLLKVSLEEDLQDVALNIIEGLVIGIAKGAGKTELAAKKLALSVIDPLKITLKEHSPSKVSQEIGQYFDEGLILGLMDYSGKVSSASNDLGFTAIDAMGEAIRASKDIVGNSLDDGSMVLTPVLDLSEIQNGANMISQMMTSAGGYSIGGTFDYANRAEASRSSADIYDPSTISLDKLSGAIEELIRNPQGSISNNFTINSTANPQEIAQEVSKIIQSQIERRQAIWGR